MKTLRALVMLVVIGAIALVLVGCSEDNSADSAATAEELFGQGLAYLEDSMADVNLEEPPWEWDVDTEQANGYFEDALDIDPDHCGALLMAAITRLAMVLQDPDLADILEGLFPDDGRGPGGPGDFLFRAFRRPDVYAAAMRLRASGRDDFPFSELQDFIDAEVLPALEYADGNLLQFEDQNCVVVLHIEVEEKRETIEFEIDATDVFLLHAPLDALQAVFHIAVSYNVDVDDGQDLQELIDEDPHFLSLRPGDHMASAYSELFEMQDHLSDCAWSMSHETDPQDTDLFTNTDDEGWILLGAGFADTLAAIAEDIYDGLENGVSFNPAEDTGEPGAPDMEIFIDLWELFNDPLDPITDYFPAHTWLDSTSMEVTEPIYFTDPTFSDITPDMTNEYWGDIYDWLDEE
ncbi:MAG: hypothetical protein KAY32_15995 [Candidatus Eisenbacteria sp.]|nr:hypothetical protein [Candidatus Eisenbacteria bacterium]